jgi:predicted dehydrogenase/threonine dehydrogenase-like Zn-dependent dehydrogenase
MKQLLQNMNDGKAEVADIPVPVVKPGYVLVRNRASVVSAGTERMIVSFAEKSLLGKAKSRPDLMKQVVDKAKREGVIPTLQSAFNRLDQPMALGYSCAGIVEEVGADVQEFRPGMRVACAGGGFATHSEYVLIPKNLLVEFSNKLSFEEAAFATLGAIALQGFRLANPQVGERIAVIGLGLLGLLMVEIGLTAGCSVFGIDLDEKRVKIANELGANAVLRENAVNQAQIFTHNKGFDSVFICADSKSNDPVELAGVISRDKGVVVAVGAVGLEIPRKNYYEKEISFLISRSYGPGRYDQQYEESGVDYPFGYVRWTEGRNLKAVIEMIENGKMQVVSFITHRFPINEGIKAYDTITGKTDEDFLGVILEYPDAQSQEISEGGLHKVDLNYYGEITPTDVNLGVLGAGLYASAVFLPVINKVGQVKKIGICSAKGLNARHAAKKNGYSFACTDEDELLESKDINSIVILTRHQDHARQVIKALNSIKHVYCEKPLAIDRVALDKVSQAVSQSRTHLMVGFNRRFAPLVVTLKEFLSSNIEPMHIHYRVNAGLIPLDHWLHDPDQGGGRIVGESCHFIDLLVFLTGELPISVRTFGLPDLGKYKEDNLSIVITFENGSIGVIDYLANGDKSVPKENIEVFAGGKVARIDDFRKITLVENGKSTVRKSNFRQDKGHQASWQAFVNAVKHGSDSPIPFNEICQVTLTSFAAVQSLHEEKTIEINC